MDKFFKGAKPGELSVEQIVSVLKEADMGTPVADLIRKVGVSARL